ncbi:NUDIX domain-containing protein [Croceitalea marina]|uniref:NUDIX domain-containing protein n=1 Tax=Croceitalea marina TaxID=1775166 RepID=A0ABW5MUM1_9FLAO
MDELIDILDENGNSTGETALKSKAHIGGLFHPTIHVWFYTKDGKILLQQRGKNKETYPLKWDVSVAGHIAAGESPEIGAFREVEEEIGIQIQTDKLEKIGIRKKEKKHDNGIWDREFTHIFLYLIDENTQLTKQDSEVEALKWVSLNEFKFLVENEDGGLISSAKERHLEIIRTITSKL